MAGRIRKTRVKYHRWIGKNSNKFAKEAEATNKVNKFAAQTYKSAGMHKEASKHQFKADLEADTPNHFRKTARDSFRRANIIESGFHQSHIQHTMGGGR